MSQEKALFRPSKQETKHHKMQILVESIKISDIENDHTEKKNCLLMYQVIKKTEKYLKGKRTIKNDFEDFRKN